ncbi:MAG TPA: class I SAM-dependent methyltransferase [Patescibacteria group bacterium]|nr:class I SAM-dependent methyltransferase [Patescibacteria group bacterium]
MDKRHPKGVLKLDYHLKRKNKKAFAYRFQRRTKEVLKAIQKYQPKPNNILDLGTADGLMLSQIKDHFPKSNCLGIEYSQELIKTNQDKRIKIIQGNVLKLPFQKPQFEVIIAAAIIEHLNQPQKLIRESQRVLKKNGILILTTPDPFWEKTATLVGHLKKESHYSTLDLRELTKILKKQGFQILEKKKFMFSPIGFPREEAIEKILRLFSLNALMANQLIIAKKK